MVSTAKVRAISIEGRLTTPSSMPSSNRIDYKSFMLQVMSNGFELRYESMDGLTVGKTTDPRDLEPGM